MNEKLNYPDLSALLAKEANISGAKADALAKAIFDIIIEGLEQDGIVKINGLGTFKITEVADRYSVNVNTGEKFEIKGHRKISFIPADTLKESVNRPFAMFAPVEIDDAYQDDAPANDEESMAATEEATPVQADAVKETAAEEAPRPVGVADIEEEMPSEETPAPAVPAAGSGIEEEQVAEECAPTVAPGDNVKSTVPESGETPEEEKEGLTAEETGNSGLAAGSANAEATEFANEEPGEPAAEEEKEETALESDTAAQSGGNNAAPAPVKKNKNILRFAFFLIIGFVCGFVAIRMMGREQAADNGTGDVAVNRIPGQGVVAVAGNEAAGTLNNAGKPAIVPAEAGQETVADSLPASSWAAADELVQDEKEPGEASCSFIMVDGLASRSDRSIAAADTTLYTMAGTMAVHVVKEDERLAKISFDYYGSRKLWPYIAKRNGLKEPYGLAVGMKLMIPVLQPK